MKSKKTCSYIYLIFWKKAIKFQSLLFPPANRPESKQTIFTVFITSLSSKKPELRTNSMVTPVIMDFWISHFYLYGISYDDYSF